MRGAGAGMGFLFNLLLVWHVGDAVAGLYFLALAAKNVATAVGKAGLERSVVRAIARAAATGSNATIHGVRQFALRRSFRASVAASVTLVALAWPLAHYVFEKPALPIYLWIGTLGVLPFALSQVLCAALRALKRTAGSQFIDSVSGPAAACLLLPPCVALFGVEGSILAHGLACTVALVLALAFWKRVAPPLDAGASEWSEDDARELVKASRPLMQTDLMNLMMVTLPTLTLGVFATESDVGVFGFAMRTAMLISFIQIGLNAILGPKFAAMWKLGQIGAIRNLARNSAILALGVALPVVGTFVFASEWVLSIFSEKAIEGASALVVLATAQLINVASGPVGSLLVMSGHERVVRNTTVGMVVLLAVLSLTLIPAYGVLGAAIAAATTVTARNLINLVLIQVYVGLFGR